MSVNAREYREQLYRLRAHPGSVSRGIVDQRDSFTPLYLSLIPFALLEIYTETTRSVIPSGLVFPLGYLMFWAVYFSYYRPGFLEAKLSAPRKWDLMAMPTILLGVTIWFVKVTVVELSQFLFHALFSVPAPAPVAKPKAAPRAAPVGNVRDLSERRRAVAEEKRKAPFAEEKRKAPVAAAKESMGSYHTLHGTRASAGVRNNEARAEFYRTHLGPAQPAPIRADAEGTRFFHAQAGPKNSAKVQQNHASERRSASAQEATQIFSTPPPLTPAKLPKEISNALGILGLKEDVEWTDIQRRYRYLAKQFHPDLNPDSAAGGRRFMMYDAAYRKLTAVKSRYFS